MRWEGITPDNTVFVILSFEGPDAYSSAGGLGVRVDGLSKTLASTGYPVHLFFIGDPRFRGEEMMMAGRLALHRWCQWISEYYPEACTRERMRSSVTSMSPYLGSSVNAL